ncbi:sensor histidine kinase [Salinigranum salinum]|uniref:sensor histidine kinase n=1 Tax=Salinigranum salinum TaxID=1364937 RepID=UPI0012610CCE|nr:ATP-binding protein [Salinigranum salinum]
MRRSSEQRATTEADDAGLPPSVDDFSPASTAPPVYRILLLVAHRRNRTLLAEWFADQPMYEVVTPDASSGDPYTSAADRLSGPAGESGDVPDDGEPGAGEPHEGVPPEWQTNEGEGDDTEPDDGRRERGPTTEQADGGDPLDGQPLDLCLVDTTALARYGAWLADRIELERPLPLPCLLLASEATARRILAPREAHELGDLVDDVIATPVEPALLERRLRAYLRLRRQAVELDRRHDQLSLLAQVLRHDVANAATVITGWGEVLRDEVSPPGTEALERVLRGGQRITELVENSRDFTALLEAGHRLETEATLLEPVLRSEVDAIRRIHASTTKRVDIELDTSNPTVKVIAGGMLPSVFANLLSNAVRHNDAETAEIHVTVAVDAREVVVRVADNGPGIPDEKKEQVFEPASKRADSPGDGLGLALVRRLVDSYGGRVWFEDAPGGGAVGCVALRRAITET